MAIKFNRSQTFATNGTVDAPSLHNLVDGLNIYQSLITDQTNVTSVSTADELLIAIAAGSSGDAPKAVTVQELFQNALTAGTYTNANISAALTYGTATGTRLVSDNATITTGTITTAVIPSLTAGTTTSTAATITSGTVTNLASTTGTIATLNSTTGTIGALNSTTGTIATLVASAGTFAGSLVNVTTGTIANLNSTSGTVATLNSTTGTIPTLVATTLITTGTGTDAAPAIVPTGDTNTGIFFPAADTLAVTTNGTERLRIASDGQIGIGGANYGTSGQVLTSAGSSAAPSWQTAGGITSGTAVASTSGTAIDFTGIPSGVKRITVMFSGVSTNGNSIVQVQLGDSGGIEAQGYLGALSNLQATINLTTGIGMNFASAANIRHGSIVFTNVTSNTWVANGNIALSEATFMGVCAGSKQLSDTLTQIRVTTVNGTDLFDAGTINILYES